MSQQSFIQYYEQFLLQPENQALRDELESASDEATFTRIAVEQGTANNFDFTADEVNAVMESAQASAQDAPTSSSSVPTVRIRSLTSVENLKKREEMTDEELDSVAGGLAKSTTGCCW